MTVASRRAALVLAIAALFVAAAGAAGSDADELFHKARVRVLESAGRLPRYTCVENISRAQYLPAPKSPSTCQALITMHRLVDARGNLAMRDRLRLDVAVLDNGEIFSWAGAGKFDTQDIGKLVGGGASGSGDFGAFLGSVFGNSTDLISYLGLRDSMAYFEYNVPTAKSRYASQRDPDPRAVPKIIGYHGSFSIDPSDADLQQLVVESEEFSGHDEACRIQQVMKYQRVKIGSGDFLLPEVTTMKGLYRNGSETENETRYSDCREYVGESTIRFDDVDTGAAQAATAKANLQPLPPRARMQITLTKPIDTDLAAAGEELIGVAAVNKESDRVRGRIIRLMQIMLPMPHWAVAIRFDSIERGGVTQPLSLKQSNKPKASPFPDLPPDAGVFIFDTHGRLLLNQFRSAWETR